MFSALLDTNVLVPSFLRDVLLEIAERGVYRVLWSNEILAELEETLLELFYESGRDDIESDVAVRRLRAQLASAFPDALVIGWEPLETGFELPDPNDRHVIAAAVTGRADVIVTDNVKDFPDDTLPTGLEVQNADEFLLYALDLHPEVVVASVERIAARTGRTGPRLTADEVISAVGRVGASQFAIELRQRRELS